jgi:hypothetical protein
MTIASFEIAKLAYEKGFNGESHSYYHKDNGDLVNESLRVFSDLDDYCIPAPLLWELLRWLREEHHFLVEVSWYNFPEGDLDNFNVCVRHPSIYTGAEDGFSMRDYDFAIECGIEHALKLIEV